MFTLFMISINMNRSLFLKAIFVKGFFFYFNLPLECLKLDFLLHTVPVDEGILFYIVFPLGKKNKHLLNFIMLIVFSGLL